MQCNGAPPAALNIETFGAVLERCTWGRRAASVRPQYRSPAGWARVSRGYRHESRPALVLVRRRRACAHCALTAPARLAWRLPQRPLRYKDTIFLSINNFFTLLLISFILNTYRSSSTTYCKVKACNFLIAIRNNSFECIKSVKEKSIHIII